MHQFHQRDKISIQRTCAIQNQKPGQACYSLGFCLFGVFLVLFCWQFLSLAHIKRTGLGSSSVFSSYISISPLNCICNFSPTGGWVLFGLFKELEQLKKSL